jgi:hypothetical protein
MNENERIKLIELTSKAVAINEELLADEKEFIAIAGDSSVDVGSLREMNDPLNELCSKELLLLAASKSLLQITTNKF